MQVVYHLGAHCTDEDRILRCLLRNKGRLAGAGIVVPGPGRYRPLLRETLVALRGGAASAEVQEILLDAVMEEDRAGRLVFCNDYFLGIAPRVVGDAGFYASAPRRVAALANLFPQAATEATLGLRNPATLIPALLARMKDASYDELMAGTDPESLSWLQVIRAIRAANPEVGLTVWCNEDLPLIWPEVLRAVAGTGPEAELAGDWDLVASLVSAEGMAELEARIGAAPPATPAERRRITGEALERHGIEAEIEVEIDLPGWTAELVDRITAAYEADCAAIRALPGLRFIAP